MTMEVNFDGIVGPSHNYSGLSEGNLASMQHQDSVSRPKQAALQGLAKMWTLAGMGIPQGVLPPHERPHLGALQSLGFSGQTDADLIRDAARLAPQLYLACCSASAMWTANAATVCPSADSADGRLHLTPANLSVNFHRSLEADFTERVLRTIFHDRRRFVVHSPLPPSNAMTDEGAANHTRLVASAAKPGVQLFVYGRVAMDRRAKVPERYPARQTLEACEAIARLHRIDSSNTIFAQQNLQAVDQGVFHNDVIAVGHEDFLFYHEQTFEDLGSTLWALEEALQLKGAALRTYCVSKDQLSLGEAVASYLFNSQIVTRPDRSQCLILPAESRDLEAARRVVEAVLADQGNRITEARYIDLRESMRNGGGPACLRLRIVMTEEERQSVQGRVFLDQSLYEDLCAWVNRCYPDSLSARDLMDPDFHRNQCEILAELTEILDLGNLYPFQNPT